MDPKIKPQPFIQGEGRRKKNASRIHALDGDITSTKHVKEKKLEKTS